MQHAHRSMLSGLLAVLVLVGFTALEVAAGPLPPDQECPEGLVYDPVGDICLLPENLPDTPEEGDQPADEGEQPADDEPLPAEEQQNEGQENGEENQPAEEPAPAAGEQQAAADPAAQIKNLTLLTFACPINWNPATRDIEASREMCTDSVMPDVTYTVLFEGSFLIEVGVGQDVDLDVEIRVDNGVPLPAGMYTIRESPAEGQEDPFAFCAIYAADGTSRLTVMETVPGGSLDILLAGGEEVNCELYSVATVPEVIGDLNAAPSLGLEVKVFSCPAPAEFSGGLDDCTLPLPGPVTFEASYGGQVMATGTLSSPEFPYEVDQEALSGEWTIRPILPEGRIDPHLTCTSVDYVGTYTGEVTYFPPADGSLGVTTRLNPDQRVQCQIWVFAGDVRDSVVVVTRDCPEDYNAATLPPGVRRATCPGWQFQPVSVTVDDAAPVEGESTRNGVAVFPAQPGTWRISADSGLDIPGLAVTFVTCDHTLAALGQVQTIEPTINTDERSISIELDEADALRCDFFFGPATTSADVPAGEEPTGVGEALPAGDDTTEPTDTTDPTEPTDTTDPTEPTDPTDTTEPSDPAESTEPIEPTEPTDTTEPAETNPSGGTFGGGSDESAGETTAPESTDSGGTTEDTTVLDGTESDDTMGEPAAEGTSELSIQHWDCPEPIAERTADDLVESCTASLEPSAWELNGEPLDAGDGYAVWEGLQPDMMRVTNQAASHKDDAASAVHCSIAPADGEFNVGVEVPVNEGGIEIVIDLPSVVYCNWFVAP